jgi:hypothetical protein
MELLIEGRKGSETEFGNENVSREGRGLCGKNKGIL